MQKILVTGGAGYIGSACVKDLCRQEINVVVLDNLSKGKKELIDHEASFEKIDLLNREELFEFFEDKKFDAVVHFAAHKDAGASMKNAVEYSENLRMMINLLDGMAKSKIAKIIFSSSAAVYGNPQTSPIDENHATNPINYYGFTKLAGEGMLEWYRKIHGIDYVSLRYFNVAGDHGLNYLDPSAKNLFPIIQEVIDGKREKLEINGDDYETRDGTCVRDYIHLSDLIDAHFKALEFEGTGVFNLGTEKGQTVLEVVKEFEKQIGKEVVKEFVGRRKGDPAELVASSKKAEKELKWRTEKGLEEMVRSTLEVGKKEE